MFTNKTYSNAFLLFLFTIVVLLQGCGAERDTGFNPTPSSTGSNSSLGAPIVVTEVYEGENPLNTFEANNSDHKQFVILRSVAELDAYLDTYEPSANFTLTNDDFAKGQVVLFDQGNIGTCAQKLLFNGSPTAFDFTAHSVKVIFKYRDTDRPNSSSTSNSSSSSSSESSSSSSSSYSEPTCDSPTVKRPYGFYYIPSRKKLLIEEQAAY